jgi:hypothetical protein
MKRRVSARPHHNATPLQSADGFEGTCLVV